MIRRPPSPPLFPSPTLFRSEPQFRRRIVDVEPAGAPRAPRRRLQAPLVVRQDTAEEVPELLTQSEGNQPSHVVSKASRVRVFLAAHSLRAGKRSRLDSRKTSARVRMGLGGGSTIRRRPPEGRASRIARSRDGRRLQS